MTDYTKASFVERWKMPIKELAIYYAQKRRNDYQEGKKLKGIYVRKLFRLLIKLVLRIDQVTSHENIIVIRDSHKKNNNVPTIYACSHIGGNDIQRALQVISKPAYLMFGDPGIIYRKLIYIGLKLNGVIPLETADREDRKIAYARSVELLQNGGNLLIFPEGAWNLSPNLVIMKTYTGTVRMAQETGAEIVPIAMEQYGDTFYVNIGENYFIPKDSDKNSDEWNTELRSKLATLKWEIMEHQSSLKRSEIPNDYLRAFQEDIINRCNFGYDFSLEDALKEAFHDKHIHNPEEVFAHLNKLSPNIKNAFLLRNR